jgi:hypothetical protein
MDCILRAEIVAVRTIDALRILPALRLIWGRAPLTHVCTSPTVIAVFANRPSQEGVSGKNAKKSAQRAEILAPETSFHKVRSQNEKKQKSHKSALKVKGLLEWEEDLF